MPVNTSKEGLLLVQHSLVIPRRDILFVDKDSCLVTRNGVLRPTTASVLRVPVTVNGVVLKNK